MLTDIKDYRQIEPRLATSGYVTEGQIAEIAEAGYEAVINLLPGSEGRLYDEDILVEEAGMEYVNIPVRWTAPQVSEAARFFEVMDAREGQRVWVHCAANLRVSAFVYLWRTMRQGLAEDIARADLDAIWTPNPIWRQFLQDAQTQLRR